VTGLLPRAVTLCGGSRSGPTRADTKHGLQWLSWSAELVRNGTACGWDSRQAADSSTSVLILPAYRAASISGV